MSNVEDAEYCGGLSLSTVEGAQYCGGISREIYRLLGTVGRLAAYLQAVCARDKHSSLS